MSRTFRFALVDAFTDIPLAGNPCAVVFGADILDSSQMLSIAKEMNQSETAFLLKPVKGDLKARYFTPEREIPLAGHPTIAVVSAALAAGVLAPIAPGTTKKIILELHDGPVDIEIDTKHKLPIIRMFQRRPVFAQIHDPALVLPLFSLCQEDLQPNAPIQTVSTGTRQLMIMLKNQGSLRKASLQAEHYRKYRDRMDFFSPHLFCLEGINPDASTFSRHLGLAPDTAEDSFTGSATGGMAAYLWRYGFISAPQFIAEQGHWMGRPGRAYVEVMGPRESIETVVVAGSAVGVVQGELTI